MARPGRYPRVFGSPAAKAQSRAAYAALMLSAPLITGAPLSPAVGINTAFAPVINGGRAPYALTLFSGALPPGRALTGLTETGTYTTAGAYNYVLRVTDAAGKTADLAVAAVVAAAGSNAGTLDFSDPNNSGLI